MYNCKETARNYWQWTTTLTATQATSGLQPRTYFFPKPMISLFHIHFGLLSELPGAINHHRCDSCSHESRQYNPPRHPVEQEFGLLKLGREHAEGTEVGTSTMCPRAIRRNSCLCCTTSSKCLLCIWLKRFPIQPVLSCVSKRPFWRGITRRSSQQQTSVLFHTTSLPCTDHLFSLWGPKLST